MFNRGKNVITLDENWTLLDRNLEDDICNICQRATRTPVSLECQHKFCRQCLKNKVVFKIIYKDTINCPLCNCEHHIAVSGVHCFDRCFPVEVATKELAIDTYMQCEQHPLKSLELFCCECKFDICQICAKEFHGNHIKEGVSDLETTKNTFIEKEQECIRATRTYLQKAKTALDFKRSEIHHFKHAALNSLTKQAERLKELIDEAVRTQENAVKENFRTFEQEVELDCSLIDEKSTSLTMAEECLSQMEEYQSDIDSFEKYKKQKEMVSLDRFSSFRENFDNSLEESFQTGQINKEQIRSMLGTIQTHVLSKANDKTFYIAKNAWNEQFVPNKETLGVHDTIRNWGEYVKQVSAEEEMFERQ